MNPRTLVVGDIHGNYLGLRQALSRAEYEPGVDTLVCLGDYVDGGPDSAEVLLYLYELVTKHPDHVVLIIGNHDEWLREYLYTGIAEDIWTSQGGKSTLVSLQVAAVDPLNCDWLRTLFREMRNYWVDSNNYLYVHGGFEPGMPIECHTKTVLTWDRDFFRLTWYGDTPMQTTYAKVFLGHTRTSIYGDMMCRPMSKFGVHNIDTGAGGSGKVTVMDAVTNDYWQSDWVLELYGHNFVRD